MSAKWEYQSMMVAPGRVYNDRNIDEMNDLGENSWELVSIVKLTVIDDDNSETFVYRAFFKRQIS